MNADLREQIGRQTKGPLTNSPCYSAGPGQVKVGEVTRELGALNEVITTLEGRLAETVTMLQPILRPVATNQEPCRDSVKESPAVSQVGQQLRETTTRLRQFVTNIELLNLAIEL